MRRSSKRIWRLVPLLLVGCVGVMLALPGSQPSVNRVGPVDAVHAKPALLGVQPATAAAPATVVPASTTLATATSAAPATAIAPVTPIAAQDDTPRVTQASLQLPAASAPAADSAAAATSAAAPATAADGRIGSSAVNVRSGPSGSAGKLFVIPAGETVKIGDTNAGWVHVYRQNGEDGWIYHRFLAGADAPDAAPVRSAAAAPSGPKRLVGHSGEVRSELAVLEDPDADAPSAFTLEPGDRFHIRASHGSWLLVETDDGYSGWIPG
jgi:SH3-like domain-containing protein